MVICPWCGTNYEAFQSNCKNCGGPLNAPAETVFTTVEEPLAPPPPAPRSISNNYTLKLMLTDATAITGLVLGIVGGVFILVGLGLIVFIITALVGIPFVIIGIPIFLVGAGLLYWRYQEKQKLVNVLRHGQAVIGEVTGLEENPMVRVNHRHPWVIAYQFRANGQVYSGSVTTLNNPTARLQPGCPSYVLFDPNAPELNALYPHP